MMRFFGFLFFVGLGLGTWGWLTGRFTVQTSEHDGTWTITTDVHKDQLAHDWQVCEQKLLDAIDAIDHKIDELRTRARTANAKSRSTLEQQLEEQEQKKEELLRDLNEKRAEEQRREDGDKKDR